MITTSLGGSSDKCEFPSIFVKAPVNDIGRHGRMRLIKNPFKAWGEDITELRRKAEVGLECHIPLIFYSPIHYTDSHFMLLEIDDDKKMIHHYDSLAEPTTVNGMKKTRIATLVEVRLALKDVRSII
jgi:Ulp1 protease family, C-terminal catalytic domain